LATFADSRFCDLVILAVNFKKKNLVQEVEMMAMLTRSNSFLYLGGVQKYRDLNNLAINFGPLAQIISRMPWIMSNKPLSRPGGMKGQFCKKITKTIGVAYVFASIVTFSWYLGVQKVRKDVYSEFNSFNDFDEDVVYERIKSKGLFWAIFYKCVEKFLVHGQIFIMPYKEVHVR
jgi:hypothetical protein